MLETMFDMRHGACDLTSDKGLTPARRLVIEQDAARNVEPVTLAVIDGVVVPECLGTSVGAARVKGRGLVLRRRGAAEHLAGGGLVEAAFHARPPHGFEQAEGPGGDDIGG